MFSINHFFKSFKFAFSGLFYVWASEQNFRFQILIAAAVIFAGLFFNFSFLEFALLVVIIVMVLAAEVLNTVIEKVLDVSHPDWSPSIKIIKDISAAIVLFFSLGALTAGILLFLPHVIQ